MTKACIQKQIFWFFSYTVGEANINDSNFNKLKSDSLPDVVLVKKMYPDRASRKRRRKWQLKHLPLQDLEHPYTEEKWVKTIYFVLLAFEISTSCTFRLLNLSRPILIHLTSLNTDSSLKKWYQQQESVLTNSCNQYNCNSRGLEFTYNCNWCHHYFQLCESDFSH